MELARDRHILLLSAISAADYLSLAFGFIIRAGRWHCRRTPLCSFGALTHLAGKLEDRVRVTTVTNIKGGGRREY